MRLRGSNFDSRVTLVMSSVKKRSAEGLDSCGIRSRSFSRHNWSFQGSPGATGLPDGGGVDVFFGVVSGEKLEVDDCFEVDGCRTA